MSEPAISVRGLGKRYRIPEGPRAPYRTLRTELATLPRRLFARRRHRNPSPDFWALRDLSFEVRTGEVLGVIGRNGAGKSTLLKILSRITAPTCGGADVRGRFGSLLEVGTGFHPELTGRENIFLSGALLGMRRAEVARRFDEIAAFAGVEQFLDTPCKHYSSGMYVRLAFAVAAHLDVDVLFLDEVLAVGDLEFQRRCLGRIRQQLDGNRTVLLVSHQLALIENACSRAILLDRGSLVADGKPAEIFARYRQLMQVGNEASSDLLARPRECRFSPQLAAVELRDDFGQPTAAVPAGAALNVCIDYASTTPLRDAGFGLIVTTLEGVRVFLVNSEMAGHRCPQAPARGAARCRLPSIPLLPGRYALEVDLWHGGAHVDHVAQAITFDVLPADVFSTGRMPAADHGMVWQHSQWQVPEPVRR